MIKTQNIKFTSISSLLNSLKSIEFSNHPIGILGGHYMLDYSKERGKLVPLIKDETKDQFIDKVADIQVGDFPAKTFEYALDLYTHFIKIKNSEAKILLLVNDHQFPSVTFSSINKSISTLRDSYYFDNKIPVTFQKQIEAYHYKKGDVLLQNCDSQKNKQFPVFLFSEYKYRKKFDRSLKKKILKYKDYFYAKTRKNGKKDIYLKDETLCYTCLTESGDCGCSGEIMEFIHQRYLKDSLKNFILFVPTSCFNAVSTGINSILLFIWLEYGVQDINIHLVSNLPIENNPINLQPNIICQKSYYEKYRITTSGVS